MTSDTYSESQRRLKSAFTDTVGGWRPSHDAWLAADEQSFELYLELATHVWAQAALTQREKALLSVALTSTVTHLDRPGIRASIVHALEAGATLAEVREVLELTSGVGIHSLIEGLPMIREATEPVPDTDPADRESVRREFEARRGYWSDFWESVLEMDHVFLEKYTDLSASPWERGSLDSKLREFVYIAIDVSTTHLYLPGLQTHIENAIDRGATRDELLCVLELASLQGYDSMLAGMLALREETTDDETGAG